MAAWWLWVQRDARRRFRPALALMLLVAVAGATILAAVAGARRNGTAAERAAQRTAPADVWVLPNEPGFDWDAVRALPEVAAVGEFAVTFYDIVGVEQPLSSEFPPASPEAGTTVERPLLVAGRRADPTRIDEVTISPAAAAQGIAIGERLDLTLPTAEEMEGVAAGGVPEQLHGSVQRVTVVGITKGSFFATLVQPTYAFYTRYRAELSLPYGYVNALVRLRGGAADIPALTAHLATLAGHPVEVVDAVAAREHVTTATHLERNALLAFALAAAAAAVVLLGQVVLRIVAASARDVPQLTALGFTHTASALAALPAAAAAAGGLAAGVGAYALSARFPVGVGRRVEPDLGRHLDWAVLGPGVAGIVALAIVGSLGIALLTLRQRPSSASPSRIASLVSGSDAPLPLVLGVRLALARPAGDRGAVRPALVGAVVGVAGIVAALTFGHGLSRAAGDPALFGQSFDAVYLAVRDDADAVSIGERLAAERDVDMVAEARNGVVSVGGRDVAVLGVQSLSGAFDLRPVRGRLPDDDDEIALSPQALADLEVGIGDRVELDRTGASMTVVGEVYSPQIRHTPYDAGGVMTEDGLRREVPDAELKFHVILIRFAPGTSAAAGIERLNREVFGAPVVEPGIPVEDQENLRGVRWVPFMLAGFLAALALGAVGHALAGTVRRRRRELAVLRTLGLTPGQARATVAWQATTLAIVGVVAGVPIGLAAGRTAWQVVAEQTPMLHIAPFVPAAVAAVTAGMLVLANAVAAWPAHRAARLRPARVLRSE